MNLQLLIPGFIGIFVGGLFSVLLGIYSSPTADKYSREIFGTDSAYLIKYISVLVISFSTMVAAGFSVMIRDFQFPEAFPALFTFEILYAAFVPASVLILMTVIRNKPFSKNTFYDFGLLSLKFGLAHLLLQASGVYSSVFKL
jgi:hypothetical protein